MNENGKIRVISLGLLEQDDHILVSEIFDRLEDRVKGFRLLGGGIEFGETALEAVVREFEEELGLQCVAKEILGVFENLFTFEGKAGHEIVFIVRLGCNRAFDLATPFALVDREPTTFARWIKKDILATGSLPLFPAAAKDMICK
jgi:8-oxo-dGTP pyrophosphatase MutT (NUDIX family)